MRQGQSSYIYSRAGLSGLAGPPWQPGERVLRIRGVPYEYMRGADVRWVQRRLLTSGIKLPQFGVDGIYGPETAAAVKQFQRQHDLPVTGKVAAATWQALKHGSRSVGWFDNIIRAFTGDKGQTQSGSKNRQPLLQQWGWVLGIGTATVIGTGAWLAATSDNN